MGDINDDGVDDFGIIQANGIGPSRLDVLFGGSNFDSVADWSMGSGVNYPTFGFSLDSCGDVNGDGGMDFCFNVGPYPTMEDRIYYGGIALDTIPDWNIYSGSQDQISGLGYINDDGYADVLVLAPFSFDPGWIYFGGNQMDTLPDLTFNDHVGAGGGIGDINGDGYNDFCLAIRLPGSIYHYARVYLGGPNVSTTPAATLQNRLGNICSASCVSSGDFNGDGYSDIAAQVGDPYYGSAVGIYLGSPQFNSVLDALVSDVSIYNGFGQTLASGDVEGDGQDELLVGAPSAFSPSDIGQAHLYTGPDTWIDYGAVAVPPEILLQSPGSFQLDQNFPNPFNSTTSIHFELGKPGKANLIVYDLLGNTIRPLLTNQDLQPGGYNVSWTGKNEFNQDVSSGIYLAVLKVDQFQQIRKMVLVR